MLLMLSALIPATANPRHPFSPNTRDEQYRILVTPTHTPFVLTFEKQVEAPDEALKFEEFEREVKAGRVTTLEFNNTGLDKRAKATAQILRKGQALIIRIRAREIPDPSVFAVTRYTLWVYLSNYQLRLYLGDLPLVLASKADRQGIRRGVSNSMFHYSSLPNDAVFGGLILTAEPAQYTPVVSEAWKPLLTTMPLEP